MEGISTVVDLDGGYEVRFMTRRRSEFESIKEACVSLVQRRGPVRRLDYLQALPQLCGTELDSEGKHG